MKKYSFFYAVVLLISNPVFAQSKCEALFEGLPVVAVEKILTEHYKKTLDLTNIIRDLPDFQSAFIKNQKPDWASYNHAAELLKSLESPQQIPLSKFEKSTLRKEYALKNENLEKQLDEALKNPEFLNNYKEHIDKNYAFFALLEKINKTSGVKLFAQSRMDLTISNRETILQAEQLIKNLNLDFTKDFAEHSGYKSLAEYKNSVKRHDETSKNIVDLMQNHVLVAMHRPENARFWIPLTGFQNQRVTGSSRGALSAGHRNMAESNLLKIEREEYKKNSVRLMPKYAEVIVGRDVKDIDNGKWGAQYGSDLWIIKKSVVEKRATWTPTDSLSPGQSTADTKVDGFIPWRFRALATPFLHEGVGTRKIFDPESPLESIAFKSEKWNHGAYYVEVQIFGDVSIHDVEALHFRGNPPDQHMMEYLKSQNIEVYDDRTGKPVKYTGEL